MATAPVPTARTDAAPRADRVGSITGRRFDRGGLVCGVICAGVVNGAVLGLIWVTHSHGAAPRGKEVNTFVDAKLVRFGKPRDLSFLPHVQATPKTAVAKKILKLTDDPDRPHKDLPRSPDEPKEERLSKIAEQFKNLREEEDDRATQEAAAEGSQSGTRGGTAAEASGDPFVLAVKAAITERWAVPSMLTPGELAKLSATACLKIDDDGKLVEFQIIEKSGNSYFDGSLNTTLGSITTLPKPFGRFASLARRGKFCAEFAKQ